LFISRYNIFIVITWTLLYWCVLFIFCVRAGSCNKLCSYVCPAHVLPYENLTLYVMSK